jgi:hypothetical protein
MRFVRPIQRVDAGHVVGDLNQENTSGGKCIERRCNQVFRIREMLEDVGEGDDIVAAGLQASSIDGCGKCNSFIELVGEEKYIRIDFFHREQVVTVTGTYFKDASRHSKRMRGRQLGQGGGAGTVPPVPGIADPDLSYRPVFHAIVACEGVIIDLADIDLGEAAAPACVYGSVAVHAAKCSRFKLVFTDGRQSAAA